MHWEERFHCAAAQAEGLIAKFQLPDIGCTSKHWWQARGNGRWRVLSERVLAAVGAPATDAQRALAAVLDASPGAVLHGPCALAWVGLRGYDLRSLLVARPRGMNGAPPTLARLHRVRALRPEDVTVFAGVPTETALRAIWSEAARYATPALADVGAKRIGHLLDAAHRLDLVTWSALAASVEDLRQRGRAGTVLMRALAEARPPGSSTTESRQEDRLEELLDRAGERRLRRQVVVGGSEPIGRIDLTDDCLPLLVEVNSERFHTTLSDRAADERRYRRLLDAGFTLGVVWEDDLWSSPRRAVATVVDARRRAAVGERVVVHSPGCPWAPPLLPRSVVLGPTASSPSVTSEPRAEGYVVLTPTREPMPKVTAPAMTAMVT